MKVLLYCTFLLQTYQSGGVVGIDMEMRERKIDRSLQLSIRSRCDELQWGRKGKNVIVLLVPPNRSNTETFPVDLIW